MSYFLVISFFNAKKSRNAVFFADYWGSVAIGRLAVFVLQVPRMGEELIHEECDERDGQ